MFYIDELKKQIAKAAATLRKATEHIASPEFAAWVKAQPYGDGVSTTASALGYMGGTSTLTQAELAHAAWLVEQAEAELPRMERCAALCEALGIDEDNISELETLVSDNSYRTEARELRERLSAVAGEARDGIRETEYRDTCKALEAAGFAPSLEDDDILTRTMSAGEDFGAPDCSERVQFETKRRHSEFWWEFTYERNGREELRGKSGEFAKLLEAVGIAEVKTK